VRQHRSVRTLFGVGTPRSLQGRSSGLGALITAVRAFIVAALTAICSPRRDPRDRTDRIERRLPGRPSLESVSDDGYGRHEAV